MCIILKFEFSALTGTGSVPALPAHPSTYKLFSKTKFTKLFFHKKMIDSLSHFCGFWKIATRLGYTRIELEARQGWKGGKDHGMTCERARSMLL
jgi:hypothetical protein